MTRQLDTTRANPHRALADALVVSGPPNVADAPNAYSFFRSNDLVIDWSAFLDELGIDTEETNYQRFQRFILNRYADVADALANCHELAEQWPAYVHDPDTVENLDTPIADPQALIVFRSLKLRSYREPPYAKGAIAVEDGCVFKVATNDLDRWYRPVGTGHDQPSKGQFEADWDGTWKTIVGLQQVFFAPRPADFDALTDEQKAAAREEVAKTTYESFPASELVRADAALVKRQYNVLKNDKELNTAIKDKAAALAQQIPQLPVEAIPTIIEQYRDLMRFEVDNEENKRKLADAASDLNYHLFTTNTTVRIYQDGTGAPQDVELQEGELYTKTTRVANWVTYHTVTKRRLFSKKSYQVPDHHSRSFDYYEVAKVDADPWVEILDYLAARQLEVYLFRYWKDGSLRAADGSSPSEVLRMCEESEEFRRRCVVALPRKEISLFGDEFVVGYDIIYRPMPDIIPMYPTVSIKEKLSYRFTWTGATLGELAATIPLSPGEEREVTLTSTYKYESSRTETATSLIDITRIDRSDFETFFEKEVRREKETTTAASASVSGSYGGIVSGSGSFSSSTTTKDMARQLNRSVQRASQEVNRRSREESTVSVSERVETTQQNTVKYKVKNINQGVTLNVAFYKLNNVYNSILRIDDLSYSIKGGRSMISSSDLTEEVTKEIDNLQELAAWLKEEDNFPFDLSSVPDDTLAGALAAVVLEKLAEEYEDATKERPRGADDAANMKSERALLIEAAALSATPEIPKRGYLNRAQPERSWSAMAPAMRNVHDDIIGNSFWSLETTFSYDSGALYADLYLGARPGTEPYSENMRRLEEQRIEAENSLTRARARYLNARSSKQILGVGGIINPSKAYVTDRDVLLMDDGHVELKLLLIPTALWDRGWSVVFKKMGEGENLQGGSFLQDRNPVEGVLTFVLPRRFESFVKLADQPESWFKTYVTVEHRELGISLAYKPVES